MRSAQRRNTLHTAVDSLKVEQEHVRVWRAPNALERRLYFRQKLYLVFLLRQQRGNLLFRFPSFVYDQQSSASHFIRTARDINAVDNGTTKFCKLLNLP